MKRNPFFTLTTKIIAVGMFNLWFSSCSDDNDNVTPPQPGTPPPLEIPANYDGSGFAAATATENAVLGQLAALTSEVRKGRQGGAVTLEAQESLFNAGNPSLAAVATTYYSGRLQGADGWFNDLAQASGGSTYTAGEPTGEGGVAGGYLFDENGLEIEQVIEKGLYGAALYNHATSLFSAEMTAANVDQALAVFGAKPDFANSGSGNVADDVRDRFMANYAARRDNNVGNGLYFQMKEAFIGLQAATKAGQDYRTEKIEAIAEVKLLWEKINAATAINYCFATIDKLTVTDPTNDQIGSALHSYSEGVGFLHGWRTINQADKLITDAQIDGLLVLLNAPYDSTPTSYKFATDPVNELPKLLEAIDQLKNIYGFSTQEIESFRNNWVSQQGR